jgi:hypothetical protein
MSFVFHVMTSMILVVCTFYSVSNRIKFSICYISKKSRKTVLSSNIKNSLNWENLSSCRCIKTKNISCGCQNYTICKYHNKVPIICFKIKNPPPVELCWQKKRNPQKKLNFFGLPQPPAKIWH